MMNFSMFLLAALLVGLAPGRAFAASSQAGTTTAGFLKLGAGARAEGLGGAFVAAADDASAVYWNPAALTSVENRSALFMHAPYVGAAFLDYAAYAERFGYGLSVGGAIEYFTPGSIDQTDAAGAGLGGLRPYDAALSVAAAEALPHGFSIGGTIKAVESRIVNAASTVAADFGVLSTGYLDGRFAWGAALSNVGPGLKLESERDPLPLTGRVGTAYRPRPEALLALDAIVPRDNATYLAFGAEYRLVSGRRLTVAARAGLNTLTWSDVPGFNGVAFGLGVGSGPLTVDYAFLPMGLLGDTHRVSLSAKF